MSAYFQIIPTENIDNTLEVYLPKVSIRSQLIYSVVLIALFGVLFSLPFIYVDISVQGFGNVRTISEKTAIKSIISGTVSAVTVRDNQLLEKEQVLFTLKTDLLDSKLQFNKLQSIERQNYIQDLSKLTKLDSNNIFNVRGLVSALYIQQYSQFKYALLENLQRQRKISKELKSDTYLYQEKVISMREYDTKTFEHNNLQAEYRLLIEKQLSLWQSELHTHQIAQNQLQAEAQQIADEKEIYIIKAPISGTIQELSGKYVGSFIQVGENLGTISPKDSLQVECYIQPKDIGLIEKEMPVSFQVDAFNYNDWGVLNGKIIDISDDFTLIENKPFFKVKCDLENKELMLKNGFKGYIKKGINLQARFLLTRRSIYQLLYDKVDDWLNPQNSYRQVI